MDNKTLNINLLEGNIDIAGLFPHLDKLKQAKYIFKQNFGLPTLPLEEGILLIRGPRQYGKSTWLEQQAYNTVREFGRGSALYLNGEDMIDQFMLEHELSHLWWKAFR